jgi:hypothetical protein
MLDVCMYVFPPVGGWGCGSIAIIPVGGWGCYKQIERKDSKVIYRKVVVDCSFFFTRVSHEYHCYYYIMVTLYFCLNFLDKHHMVKFLSGSEWLISWVMFELRSPVDITQKKNHCSLLDLS